MRVSAAKFQHKGVWYASDARRAHASLKNGNPVLTIRIAEPGDRAVLERLGADTYRQHFTGIWSPARLEAYIEAEYGAKALDASLARPDLAAWLIAGLPDGTAIGFAKLNWDRALPVALGGATPHGSELQKIYFLAEQAGRGHGARLLAAIAAMAKARAPLLWLDVLKSNTRARAFYERNGFQCVGEFPFATDLEEIGMWVMARRLIA